MYYFIVNHSSRSGQGAKIWEEIREYLEKENIEWKACMTKYVGHALTLAREISSLGSSEAPVFLIAVGGDGTIHEVLSGIRDLSAVIFGFIPAGSGNDFCRGMHIPNDYMEALKLILSHENIASMDVPRVHLGSKALRFGISTGIGYDAAVCQEVLSSPLKKTLNRLHLGKLTYLIIALKQLLFIRQSSAIITIDEKKEYVYHKIYLTAVMNQKYEGGGFQFCPAADPSDGMLDIFVVEGLPKLLMLLMLPTAFWGGHTHLPGIHIHRGRRVRIETSALEPVHVDGESGGVRRSMEVTLEDTPLRIILPPGK